MAGDIGIQEKAVVITTEAELGAAGHAEAPPEPRVLHQYGNIGIAEAAPGDTGTIDESFGAAGLEAGLDPIAQLGLQAFELRQSAEYIAAKQRRPYQGALWDAGPQPLLPPDPPPEIRRRLEAPEMEAFNVEAEAVVGTTSQRMTGKIAVGIIIVSGPSPDLQFSAAERQKIVAEVQNGLGWLASQSPAANITWIYDIHSVTVNAQPGSSPDKEALWRNPAMQALGYAPSWNGVVTYVNTIRTNLQTQWSYVAYFTKYPLDWFAYASIGGPRLVMQYANDGWGPDNIDRVYAHETGHIFQAPDEYKSSGCNCGGSWGYFDQPNTNCENCAPGGGVDCLMRSNSWAFCNYTPWHFGFPWPSGRTINQIDSTPASPSVAVFNSKLVVLFKANDPSNRIYATSSSNGATWPAAAKINNTDSTPASPTACVFNNRLYAIWKANDPSNRMYYSASADGVAWPAGQTINNTDSTPLAAGACVFNGKLYLFWKANDASNRIYYSASSNGTSWPGGAVINGVDSTRATPVPCVFNNRLYVFWKANDPSNRIYYSASANGTSWPSGALINNADSTPDSLSALVYGSNLLLFWKANDASNRIFVSASANGTSWPAGRQINVVDSTPVAVDSVVFNNNPYVFWKANNSSNRILFSP